MSDPKLYPIAPQIFETRESELSSKLPELYPNESERQIAEQILVPQLRSVIAEALSNFNSTRGELSVVPPSPAEFPNLCAKVDTALDANRNLLDSEGLGKPLFEFIQSVRESVKAEMEEAFRAHCHLLLATHGITDRAALFAKGAVWFQKADFPAYGKGCAFAGLVLGETVYNLSLGHLRRIADILGWPEPNDQEKIQGYCAALAAHGVSDRAALLAKGSRWLTKADFPPYGKGMAFAGLILGETVGNVTLDHLNRIADILGWPEGSPEERLQVYRSALAAHGVSDRTALLAKGSKWFNKTDFPPYGKGMAFAGLILGETVGNVTLDHLSRVADLLSLPHLSDEARRKCRDALAAHGVSDRTALLAKGPKWFIKSGFPPFGRGMAFASLVLGEPIPRGVGLSLGHLRRIADILGWPEPNDQEKIQGYCAILAAHGVSDRATLLAKGSEWFNKTDFPPYGKGKAFAGLVLGETVVAVTHAHLGRIAEILGWPEPNEQEKFQAYRFVLASHGIHDRATLLAKGPIWFKKADFPLYGKGSAFAGLVLGETVGYPSVAHLRRIADILFPESK